MQFRNFITQCLFGLFIIASLYSCTEEKKTSSKTAINIQLKKDPERLNPIYDSRSVAREVYQYLVLPLADYHPETLELYPILINKIPQAEVVDDKTISYSMEFKPEAKWSDGTDITGIDYAFTIKAVKHPATSPRLLKSYFDYFKDVIVDKDNPKKFKVYIDKDYMLGLELVSTIYILAKHNYTNASYLDKFTVSEIENVNSENKDSLDIKFIEEFNDPKFYTDQFLTNGPYELKDWNKEQSLSISAKENYWGANEDDNPFLKANFQSINFRIIPDLNLAMSAFKDGKLDIIKGLSAANYDDLKKELPNASFQTVDILRYLYFALNNQDKILKNIEVRKALNHLINKEEVIEKLENGYGTETSGPFHPAKPYYYKDPTPVKFSIEEAKTILKNDGWVDSNNNGTVDKTIEGSLTELELDLLITGSELGKNISLLLQSNAEKAGIKITITPKDIRRMRSENLYNYNYQMAALAEGQSHTADDPYNRWHSDNIKEKGTNTLAFNSPVMDSLINELRNEVIANERLDEYKEMQEIINDAYPCIFLYAPQDKFVFSESISGTVTSKSPGYLANTFKAK